MSPLNFYPQVHFLLAVADLTPLSFVLSAVTAIKKKKIAKKSFLAFRRRDMVVFECILRIYAKIFSEHIRLRPLLSARCKLFSGLSTRKKKHLSTPLHLSLGSFCTV